MNIEYYQYIMVVNVLESDDMLSLGVSCNDMFCNWV